MYVCMYIKYAEYAPLHVFSCVFCFASESSSELQSESQSDLESSIRVRVKALFLLLGQCRAAAVPELMHHFVEKRNIREFLLFRVQAPGKDLITARGARPTLTLLEGSSNTYNLTPEPKSSSTLDGGMPDFQSQSRLQCKECSRRILQKLVCWTSPSTSLPQLAQNR